MTIRLISGIPGSGKTLYAVSELKKIIERNITADEPIKIYCDITGLKITDIPPPPLDWRETPPRSLLIYDEAQLKTVFKHTRGLSPYEQIEQLTIHRKTGHEIWFITQDPKRLHNDILAMVELHHHLDRPYGAKLATIYQWRGAERNPNSIAARNRVENKRLFNYDKSLYDLYESSQVDDGIKFRLPRELTFWLVVLAGTTYWLYYLLTSDSNQKFIGALTGKDMQEQVVNANTKKGESVTAVTDSQVQQPAVPPPPAQPPAPPPLPAQPAPTVEQLEQDKRVYMYHRKQDLYKNWLPADYEILQSDLNLQVRGVISNGKDCKAYNTHGHLMTLTKSECEWYLSETGRVFKVQSSNNIAIIENANK